MTCIKNRIVPLFTALALCCGAGWVAAEEHEEKDPAERNRHVEESFKKKDVNNDAKLSMAEFKAAKTGEAATAAEKMFKESDTDEDGFLSLAEYKVCMAKHDKKKSKDDQKEREEKREQK